MLVSAVSSKMIQRIAQREGFLFEETLTGFKWLGNRANELEKQGKVCLFAFEEALGYMIGSVVKGIETIFHHSISPKDKDGILAMGVIAQFAHHLYSLSLTLHGYLQTIYEK